MKGWKKLVIGIFLMPLILTVSIPLTSAWSGSGGLSPYTIYQGEATKFTLTVSIDDSRSTDVSWVTVHFGWQPSGTVYYFKSDDGTRVSISGYGSHDFETYIAAPDSALGQYTVEIKVHAQATGDWWAETYTFTDYVDVNSIPTLQVSATGNPNSGTAPLTVSCNTTVSGGLSPYTYLWSFGDGGSSSQRNPSHIYTSAGTYTAQVTVTDGAFQTQIVSDSVTINVSAPTYTLTTSVSPSGSGSVSPSSGTYDEGTSVTLTASAASGYVFDHWSGDASGTSSTTTITMSSNKSVAAHFTSAPGIPLVYVFGAIIAIAVIAILALAFKKL